MPKEALKPLTVTKQQLDIAYQWLWQQRKHYPANADIWSFRFHWENNKSKLLKEINSGNYEFSPLKRIYKKKWTNHQSLFIAGCISHESPCTDTATSAQHS